MKTLFTLLCLPFLLLMSGCAISRITTDMTTDLPMDPTTGKITYSGVVEVPGASKADLYNKSLSWTYSSFKSGTAVIEVSNFDSGLIIGKGWSPMQIGSYSYQLNYTIKAFLKEGRYRYEITNLDLKGPMDHTGPAEYIIIRKYNHFNGVNKKPYQRLKDETVATVTILKNGIENSLKNAAW